MSEIQITHLEILPFLQLLPPNKLSYRYIHSFKLNKDMLIVDFTGESEDFDRQFTSVFEPENSDVDQKSSCRVLCSESVIMGHR